ncbi:MAG: InlB B-repeat-containing protein [Anaeroplasmataceae bacterium]|nr:InlB B-repeat-containing protein [Anaeroplasmataceae bacterium]MDE6415369.1 InlB B-repeat-containing protein [Anaeroplasmataceae bacterium]
MKKIKGLLFAFVALFAFTLAMVKVSASVDYAYLVDTDAGATTEYAKNAPLLTTHSIATINVVRKSAVSATGATAGKATCSDGEEFVKGLVPGGNCADKDNAALKIVSKVAGAKVGLYYTTSDSNFASKDAVNPGQLIIMDADGTAVQTFDEIAGKNDEACYAEYTINTANTTIYIGSNKRLITWGIVLSQGVVSQEYTITVKETNGVELKQQKVTSGAAFSYAPSKYGYDFDGYFTDVDLTASFDTSNITADATVYVKWTPWTIDIQNNVLSSELIAKVTEAYGGAQFAENLPLEGTIYTLLKGSSLEASSSSVKTNGGLDPKTGEKGISFVAPANGVLTVEVKSGGSTARNAKLQTLGDNDKYVEISTTSGSAAFEENADKNETNARVLTYAVENGKTYYFGGSNGLKVCSMTFAVPEASVNLLQERVAVDDVEHIRLVAVVENIADLSGLSFVLKGGSLATDLVLTNAAKYAYRVTNNGETYSIGEVSFEAKDGVVYVKCVVKLDSKYVADSFTAELTVGGITKTVTINALA